ncbi:MAG: dATP/dGTP diphosphohydrolase domain-containing protein [Nanoarchaeota archaeon]
MSNEPKKDKGLRFNENKTRYDLLEPFAIEQLAKVFTEGAKKYTPFNWMKGMVWSKCLASLKRHIAKFEQGEDFDEETKLYHMAHAAWNALALVSYYKYYPQGDDRLHTIIPKPKIALDIDDVCCVWVDEWCKFQNIKIPSSWYFQWNLQDLFQQMRDAGTLDEFYANLPPKINPNDLSFEPIAYISHRPVSDTITKTWLEKHGFPLKPVYHVENRLDKIKLVKEIGADIFIDDSYETYKAMNEAGVCCYLMDALHNRRFDVGYRRLYDLKEFGKQ